MSNIKVKDLPTLRYIRRFAPYCNPEHEWMITFNTDELFEEGELKDFSSSYHVVGARLLGLPYHEYLLYMAKKYNGMLRGRRGYCHVTFREQNDCIKACDELEWEWRKVKEALDLN